MLNEYLKLVDETTIVDDEFLESYNKFMKEITRVERKEIIEFNKYELVKPNFMQQRALQNLNKLRSTGESRALVIAATGTGKTYMSAFDVINYNPQRVLFLVHREEILRSAEKTFRKLGKNHNRSTGLLTGTRKDFEVDFLFSTNWSMDRNLDKFNKDQFEYIIIDEAHHASNNTYQKIINYFKPRFLLGMTATPERCDDVNIFDIFDNNVALELRLREALELNLVIPFHYFGIIDIEGIDLSDVDISDIPEITKRLNVNKRVDFIIDKMNFYGYDGEKMRCIGFCVSKDHAHYMADEFNKRGIKSISLTSENSAEEREYYIKQLEADEEELSIIFTVDIFNEGVDIPSINIVLMLRPTDSPIIFIQQLGRDLRKTKEKAFLTVLDFIGNHNKAFLIAIALNGSRYYDKDSLKVAVATEFANIPGCKNIQMDRISQERILKQLTNENFNSMKYLREEYNEFKKMNSGRVPYFLMDFEKFDGAPDPLKFINKDKTYIGFVARVEKDEALIKLLENEDFFKFIRELSGKLPIKRVYEFCIIKYLLKSDSINATSAKNEILKYIDTVDDDSVNHVMQNLNQNFYDPSQKKSGFKFFELNGDTLTANWGFKKLLQDKVYRKYIEDVVNYALIRYKKELGNTYYGMQFFKHYEQYQMADPALLSNYRKTHSSFRGSGLLTNGKEYFLLSIFIKMKIQESQ